MKLLLAVALAPLILTSAAEWRGFSSSNNLFAPSLYREILKTNHGNFMVSPFSAELVLAFVEAGAKNDTAEELQAALHLPENQEKVQSSIKTLLSLLSQNEGHSLNIANKIYLAETCHIKEQFTKIATEVFSSEVEAIDFSEKAEAAKRMNKWVEEHTKDKIRDLIDPDVLTKDTRAVLINALYFQGKWLQPFGTKNTEEKDFYIDADKVVKAATMHLKNGLFNYYENSNLKAKFLEMPFRNINGSMVFVLPDEKGGLSSLEEHIEMVLSPQKFTNTFIHVSLPKFKIESTFDFTEILKNLGVVKAFDEDQANLSGIAEEKLHISKVAQKSFIAVSEGGVEAAAASFEVISPRIYALLHFEANHPFIFYIRIEDIIVFVGRVITPSYEN